jgi:hypothetical protein
MADGREHFLYASRQVIYVTRHYLTQRLREKTGSVVQYGILKGYEVGVSDWAEAAAGTYLLGTYEAQVCAILDMLKSPERVLIDIGAADGLYGVGLVAVGAFGRSLCFEADETRRQNLLELSSRLGLADRVAIYGAADAAAISRAIADHGIDTRKAVVVCDIEGGEFDLFDASLLEILSDCQLIVETHDFLLKGAARSGTALPELKLRAQQFFNVHEIKDGLRYVRDIPLLAEWSDADTWMMCMEGRRRMMTWLYLAPKREPVMRQEQIDALIYEYQKRMFE